VVGVLRKSGRGMLPKMDCGGGGGRHGHDLPMLCDVHVVVVVVSDVEKIMRMRIGGKSPHTFPATNLAGSVIAYLFPAVNRKRPQAHGIVGIDNDGMGT